MPVWRLSAYIVVGLAALIFGGDMCVDNASQIARRLGVRESVIAITLVAGGTSLPELASSVAAVLKRRPSLALGNVLGSNIANILLILGTSSVITPLDLKGVALSDVWLSILGSFLLLASAVWIGRNRLTRVEGRGIRRHLRRLYRNSFELRRFCRNNFVSSPQIRRFGGRQTITTYVAYVTDLRRPGVAGVRRTDRYSRIYPPLAR